MPSKKVSGKFAKVILFSWKNPFKNNPGSFISVLTAEKLKIKKAYGSIKISYWGIVGKQWDKIKASTAFIFVFSFCNDLLNYNTISLLFSFLFATWEHSEWEEEVWIILFHFSIIRGIFFDWQEKKSWLKRKKIWNDILFNFPSHSWKLLPLKNKDF